MLPRQNVLSSPSDNVSKAQELYYRFSDWQPQNWVSSNNRMIAANVESQPLNMGNMLTNCHCTGSNYYSIKTSNPDR